MSPVLGAVADLLAATAKKPASSSSTFLIFLILIAVAGYFLLLRPQQQKAKRQRAQQSNIEVGDEVQTVGGIVGHVVDMDNDRVTIVTGHQTATPTDPNGAQPHRIHLVRQAIARKVEPVIDPPAADLEPEAGDEEDDDSESGTYDHELGAYDPEAADVDDAAGEHDGYSAGDGRAAGSGGTGP